MGSIRIAVFEQMPLFRAGIIQVLNTEAGMEVVAEGNSIPEAVAMSAAADVVIVDANLLEGSSGPAGSLVALCSTAKVILLTFSAEGERMRDAFAAGVRGCVLKGAGRPELLEAVRNVYRGEGYLSPALAASMMRNLAVPIDSGVKARYPAQLTYREDQIFRLLSAGLKNKEIGRRLNLSEKSIKRYVTCIFEKLNVRNRVEAAMLSRANPQPAAGLANGGVSGGIARAPQATPLLDVEGGPTLAAKCVAVPPRSGSAWPILPSLAQHTLDASASTPARLGSATAHCFFAIFGRTRLAHGDATGEPEGLPRGTHILL